jgi:hypothetical protein
MSAKKSSSTNIESSVQHSNEKIHYACKDCKILRESFDETGLKYYDELMKVEKNKERCESMAYNVMLNIITNNTLGIKHQLKTLASCGDCELNYKLTKIKLKMEEIGETEGINYYRTWVEDDVWNMIPWNKKWKLYHDVHKSWIWPTFAALIGLSPMIFRQGLKGLKNVKAYQNKSNSTGKTSDKQN